jgi:hypothetical protein
MYTNLQEVKERLYMILEEGIFLAKETKHDASFSVINNANIALQFLDKALNEPPNNGLHRTGKSCQPEQGLLNQK